MVEIEERGEDEALFARFDAVLDEFAGLDLTARSDEQLVQLATGLERRVRRLATIDHALISEVNNRGLGYQHGLANTTTFLARLLRIGAAQARARARAAQHLAPRRTLTGELLDPEFPATAAAQADGAISVEHARVITSTIQALPVEVRDEQFDQVETELASYARRFGLDQFRLIARHLADVLDPDGILREEKYRERQRGITANQRADGSVSGRFEGTAAFGEAMLALFDKFAAPVPQADGAKDPRSPAQRRHDGLLDAMNLLLRSESLGDCNGVTTTMIVTVTRDQLDTKQGLARTGHGALIPVTRVLNNLGDTRIFPVVLDHDDEAPNTSSPDTGSPDTGSPDTSSPGTGSPDTGPPDTEPPDQRWPGGIKPVAAYGTTHRIFTEGQRLAMIARDKGCSFPGCTAGPAWCQANHVTEWQYGKKTTVDDGALLCGFHHREFENLGWHCVMLNRIPHYIPPYWLDPDQTPQRNTIHDVFPAA